jgi:hypothetical protein
VASIRTRLWPRGLFDRVHAIGGRLDVTSAPGEGTRVCARLPTHVLASLNGHERLKQPTRPTRFRSTLSETLSALDNVSGKRRFTPPPTHAMMRQYRSPRLAGDEAPELLAAVVEDRCPVGKEQMVEVNLGGEPSEAFA